MNSGSLDSLKVSLRCGCNPKARQMRLTVLRLKPDSCASERVLQCVASRGSDSSVVVSTCSTSASLTLRGVPGRGSSSKPSNTLLRKREHKFPRSVAARVPAGPLHHLAYLQHKPE